jgi:hypothetical protein
VLLGRQSYPKKDAIRSAIKPFASATIAAGSIGLIAPKTRFLMWSSRSAPGAGRIEANPCRAIWMSVNGPPIFNEPNRPALQEDPVLWSQVLRSRLQSGSESCDCGVNLKFGQSTPDGVDQSAGLIGGYPSAAPKFQ